MRQIIWTVDKIKEEALKYKLKIDFMKNCSGAYQKACKLGIIDEVCSHMPKRSCIGKKPHNFKWTFEKLKKEALKYKTKKEFFTIGKKAYDVANRLHILPQICGHLEDFKHRVYTEEELCLEAKKYLWRSDFKRLSFTYYLHAKKLGILEKACSHMLRGCGQSRPEIEIKEYITELGFDCKKSKQSAKILNKDHIKFLEIDVLIPSINKGIEFDGRYWHTFESLKKSRKDWPEEDIVNYHEIKDRFFELKGIKILHIKEDDWILDKEKCLEQIKFFILNEVK